MRSALAEQLEDLNRERQAVEERILRAATAEIESWPEARRRRRGYVVAGEEWHEGVIGIVASRLVERFGRPVVLIAGSASGGDWKGSGAPGGSFDLHGGARGLRRAPRALRRPPRRRRPLDPPRERRGLRRGVRRLRRRGARRRRPAPADPDRRDRPRLRARAAALRGARPARALRARQPRDHAARRRLRARGPRHGRRGQAPPLPGQAARPRRRPGDRLRASAPRSTATAASGTTTSPSGCRRTAGTAPSRPSSSSAASSTPTSATRSSAAWFAEQWRRGEAAVDARGAGGVRRARPRGWSEAEPARVGDLPGAARGSRRWRRRPSERPRREQQACGQAKSSASRGGGGTSDRLAFSGRAAVSCLRPRRVPCQAGVNWAMAVLERHQDLVDELLAEVEPYKPDVDRELLTRAFQLSRPPPTTARFAAPGRSSSTTRGGRRRSSPGCRLDEATLAAALLHDTVEDTGIEDRGRPGRVRRGDRQARRGRHQADAGASSRAASTPRPRTTASWSSRWPRTSG